MKDVDSESRVKLMAEPPAVEMQRTRLKKLLNMMEQAETTVERILTTF